MRRPARSDPDAKPLPPDKAFAYAVRALSQKALTERELGDKLRQRNASPETVAATLERLREYNFVDDAGLAERAARDPRVGLHAVRTKLRVRGLDEHTIEDALAGRDPEADLEGARALFERHRGKWTGERAYTKAYAFLSRRGYPAGVVAEVLKELPRGSEPEPDE